MNMLAKIASRYTQLTTLALMLASCGLTSEPLSERQTASLAVQAKKVGQQTFLKITGLSQHNVLSIYKIIASRRARSINVTAFVQYQPGAVKRSLEYELVVPADVQEVTFGPKKDMIWTRSGVLEKPR